MKVRFTSPLKDIVGLREIQISCKRQMTIAQILEMLSRKYGERFRHYLFDSNTPVMFLLNGRNITFLKGTETIVKDDDILAIVPVAAGG